MEEPATTPSPELPFTPPSLWPVLQRLGGGAWPPQDGPAATRFVEAAVEHGLLPLLLWTRGLGPRVTSCLLYSLTSIGVWCDAGRPRSFTWMIACPSSG